MTVIVTGWKTSSRSRAVPQDLVVPRLRTAATGKEVAAPCMHAVNTRVTVVTPTIRTTVTMMLTMEMISTSTITKTITVERTTMVMAIPAPEATPGVEASCGPGPIVTVFGIITLTAVVVFSQRVSWIILLQRLYCWMGEEWQAFVAELQGGLTPEGPGVRGGETGRICIRKETRPVAVVGAEGHTPVEEDEGPVIEGWGATIGNDVQRSIPAANTMASSSNLRDNAIPANTMASSSNLKDDTISGGSGHLGSVEQASSLWLSPSTSLIDSSDEGSGSRFVLGFGSDSDDDELCLDDGFVDVIADHIAGLKIHKGIRVVAELMAQLGELAMDI